MFFIFAFKSVADKIIVRDMLYNPPLVSTVISSISIGVAGIFSVWILLDIFQRRRWKSIMAITYVRPLSQRLNSSISESILGLRSQFM